jgi:hypothetical protein
MNKVIVKKALLLTALGGLVLLGYHAQRYARLMWELRPSKESTDEEPKDVSEQELDEEDGIIRLTLGPDDDDDEDS